MNLHKTKGETNLDRQYSSTSTITRASSWTDLSSSYSTLPSTAGSAASLPSIRNLLLSFAVFGLEFYFAEYFVPNHDHVFDRPHPYQRTIRGDTILDFQLNKPLVHQASVPCEF